MSPKSSLGRGLGAILPDILKDIETNVPYSLIGIEELTPNRFQSREVFHEDQHRELVESIKNNGILQPIIARKTDRGYEIIAGERRWRAAQAAGLKTVPVIIRNADDVETAKLSLIENLLRESLNPLEEAKAYQTLIEAFGLTQDEVSRQVGKDRSTIANTLRLLKLADHSKKALSEGKITPGHARAILALDSGQSQREVLEKILKNELNVRDTELLIARKKKPKGKPDHDPYLRDLEGKLSKIFMTSVRISQGNKSGRIEFKYSSGAELERIISLFLKG